MKFVSFCWSWTGTSRMTREWLLCISWHFQWSTILTCTSLLLNTSPVISSPKMNGKEFHSNTLFGGMLQRRRFGSWLRVFVHWAKLAKIFFRHRAALHLTKSRLNASSHLPWRYHWLGCYSGRHFVWFLDSWLSIRRNDQFLFGLSINARLDSLSNRARCLFILTT